MHFIYSNHPRNPGFQSKCNLFCFVLLCFALPHFASLCITLPYFASLCFTLPYFASLCFTLPYLTSFCLTLPRLASLCFTLPHFASLCVTLPHFAPLCFTLPQFVSLCLILPRFSLLALHRIYFHVRHFISLPSVSSEMWLSILTPFCQPFVWRSVSLFVVVCLCCYFCVNFFAPKIWLSIVSL